MKHDDADCKRENRQPGRRDLSAVGALQSVRMEAEPDAEKHQPMIHFKRGISIKKTTLKNFTGADHHAPAHADRTVAMLCSRLRATDNLQLSPVPLPWAVGAQGRCETITISSDSNNDDCSNNSSSN